MRVPRLLPAVVVAALPGCGSPSAMEPATTTVRLVYVPPSSEPDSCSAPAVAICSASCAHHNAPIDSRVGTSWGEQTSLERCGQDYCANLSEVPVGRDVGVLVFDISQCCRDCTAAVKETVFANGTRLVRFGPQGLAFVVNGRGVVTP